MMRNLLIKEFKLALHPTAIIFMSLSLMMLIPNYPFYVNFFYTTLALFFVCLAGRENNDIPYTLSLPVKKRDVVRARILFAVLMEMAQLILAVLMMLVRNSLAVGPNQAGMDANIAFFGFSLVLLGLFNAIFFTRYYCAPQKIGRAFALSAAAFFIVMLLMEASTFVLPFVKTRLDTPDPLYMPEKLITLACGFLAYGLLTISACRRAEKRFESLDL